MKKTAAKNDIKGKLQPLVALFNGGDAGKIFQPPVGEKLAPVVREIGKPIGVATYRITKRPPNSLQGQIPTPDQIAALLEKACAWQRSRHQGEKKKKGLYGGGRGACRYHPLPAAMVAPSLQWGTVKWNKE